MDVDRFIKYAIKARKKEIRESLWKLACLRGTIIILFCGLAMLLISYPLRIKASWISNVLISASCGCFTGVVLYFLTNLRNNKLSNIQDEYDHLKNIENILMLINTTRSFHRICGAGYRTIEDRLKDGENIYCYLGDLENAMIKVPKPLWQSLDFGGSSPLSSETVEQLREDYLNICDDISALQLWISKVVKDLKPLLNAIGDPIIERRHQIRFLRNSLF